MLKTALSTIMVVTALAGLTPAPVAEQQNYVVDSVEDNVVAIEIDYGIMRYEWGGSFNTLPKEGEALNVTHAIGTLANEVELLNGDTAYQFKSYDNEVWWLIDSLDVKRPDVELRVGGEYILTYFDNGTTKDHYKCIGKPCKEKDDCECWVYDDILLDIYESRV